MAQRKHSRGISATHGVPLLLIAISLLTLSISTRSLFRLPGAIASAVTSGAQFVFSTIGDAVKRTVFSIGELSNLRSQYDTLAGQLEKYSTLERDFADMQAENSRLKEQLGFAQNITTIISSAQIIGKEPGNLYASDSLDKGSSLGIAKNMAVVAFQNGFEGLAGKILESSPSSSRVLPSFDQRFFVSARLSRTRAEGLVAGQGNPDEPFVMRYVSKLNAEEIQIGDMVVTSGLDSIYPADLAIGRVKKVQVPPYGSSAVIYLDPILNFSKLEYLFIVQKQAIPAPETASEALPAKKDSK
jgi:rod shape-determining protein MreC